MAREVYSLVRRTARIAVGRFAASFGAVMGFGAFIELSALLNRIARIAVMEFVG